MEPVAEKWYYLIGKYIATAGVMERISYELLIDESDTDYWFAWSTEVVWQPDAFRSLLGSVAEDRDSEVMFLSKRSDCIFAPYDGGADGFSFDTALIARLKLEFSPWLSSRQDGL